MVLRFLLVLTFVLTGCGFESTPAHIQNSTVMVLATMTVRGLGPGHHINHFPEQVICSGWPARSSGNVEVIVTAGHCMKPQSETFFGIPIETDTPRITAVQFSDGDRGEAIHEVYSNKSDLGEITVVSTHQHPDTGHLTDDFYQDEPLRVLGAPAGNTWSLSHAYVMRGRVASHITNLEWNTYQIACDSCYYGDSGAAAWDADGNVVGVVVYSGGNGDDFYIIPAWQIRAFLNEIP